MPKSKNKLPAVPDAVLRQLAKLAHVPPAKSFFDAIRTNVRAAHERDELVKMRLSNKKATALHRGAITLYEMLGKLNKNERKFIKRILDDNAEFNLDRISSGGVDGLEQTAYQLAKLFSLVTDKASPRFAHQALQLHKRGRRKGDLKNPIFQNFVCNLLISTTAAGGNLTNDKNGLSGTLIEAIEILRPHLPGGFDPKSLSFSTYQRLKTRCKTHPEMI